MLNLLNFQKPQRYIGNELNVIKKNHSNKTSFCLCYPNLYEIGMDNLGLRIIYGLLNSYPDIVCERLFLPGQDLLEFLKSQKKPLFSLETKTELNKFDFIGFNFGYELNYLNFLEMLEAGGVAVESKKRKDTIVIGGGIANPQPLADFVDVFCLGEFEAVTSALVRVLRKKKTKFERLKALSENENFYLPSFYDFSFFNNKYQLKKRNSQTAFLLKRAKLESLDKSFFPIDWLTPHSKLVQDRVPLEIARGCPNSCNFCQARNIYRPYREKNVKTIINQIKRIYKKTGYENFSLLSLSTSNYSMIEELLEEIIPFARKNRISLSLPSLKIGDSLISIYRKLLPLQKTPLTVAIEAGTQKLREKLNKPIEVNKLFNYTDTLYRFGLRSIKVYFMYGFPDESQEDLESIGVLIRRLQQQTQFKINVSINLFIPKPCSRWEDVPFCGIEEARIKKKIILKSIPKSRRIKVNFSDLDKSLIETVLSRADNKISPALLRLHKKQKKLTDKNKIFSWPIWEKALSSEGIDWKRYLDVGTENFPWSFIKG